MQYLKRNIDKELLNWRESPIHKPLLLRGARQVGKSMSLRNLGKSFKYYIEINLEEEPDLKTLFEEVPDVREVAQRIGMIRKKVYAYS